MSTVLQEGVAHFSVEGEFVTGIVRDLVRDGRWRSGFTLLTDCIAGGMTAEQVQQILQGTHMLTGVNELEFVEDTRTEAVAYRKHLAWQFAGVLRIAPGDYFQPYAVATSFSWDDLPKGDIGERLRARYGGGADYLREYGIARARYYATDPERDHVAIVDRQLVLFHRLDDPPLWVRGVDKAEEALAQYTAAKRRLEVRGAHVDEMVDTLVQQMLDEEEDEREATAEDDDATDTAADLMTGDPLASLMAHAESMLGAAGVGTLKAMMGEYDEESKPVPDPTLADESGWITPDGDFYGCAYHEHGALARRLLIHTAGVDMDADDAPDPEQEGDRRGWVRIQKSALGMGTTIMHGRSLAGGRGATPKQVRTVMDWCAKHKQPFPSWINEE